MPSVRHRGRTPWSRLAYLAAAVAGAGLVAVLVPTALALRDIERVDLDVGAYAAGEPPTPSYTVPLAEPELSGSTPALTESTSVLLIGSDSREGLDDLTNFGAFEGRRADVVILLLAFPDRPPTLVSIPRDLWVTIPCDGREARINEALEGCGDPEEGPSVLAAAVEELTGREVDHYVEVDLAGFPELIDLVGGVEICVPHPTRDAMSGLDLPAGCAVATGKQALAWIRSRHTEELADGRWRPVEGVSDLQRNDRQRRLLIELFRKAKEMRSPGQLARVADAAADHLTIDRRLDLIRAADLVWSMRTLDPESILSLSVPVEGAQVGEAAVLAPAADVPTWLTEELDRAEAGATTADGRRG